MISFSKANISAKILIWEKPIPRFLSMLRVVFACTVGSRKCRYRYSVYVYLHLPLHVRYGRGRGNNEEKYLLLNWRDGYNLKFSPPVFSLKTVGTVQPWKIISFMVPQYLLNTSACYCICDNYLKWKANGCPKNYYPLE